MSPLHNFFEHPSVYFEGPRNESQRLNNVMQLNGQYYLPHDTHEAEGWWRTNDSVINDSYKLASQYPQR